MKINFGCGTHHKTGYLNVDKFAPADLVVDLEDKGTWSESFTDENGITACRTMFNSYLPWPWGDSSVEEALFHHSLEHMGETTAGFFHIMKELYRVMKHDGIVDITVPHPRHDDFLNDPTHVRPITPMILTLFDRSENEAWAKSGVPNSPLGLQLGVDFRIIRGECKATLDPIFTGYPEAALKDAILTKMNVIKMYNIKLRVVK